MADLVAGDTATTLTVTCKTKSNGSVIDLTGKTVELIWETEASPFFEKRTMSIVDAPNGKASYQFAAGEVIADHMEFEVKITDATSKELRNLDTLVKVVRPAIEV